MNLSDEVKEIIRGTIEVLTKSKALEGPMQEILDTIDKKVIPIAVRYMADSKNPESSRILAIELLANVRGMREGLAMQIAILNSLADEEIQGLADMIGEKE